MKKTINLFVIIAIFLFINNASASTLTVDGKSNIFGAGHTSPPAPYGGAGILPPVYTFVAQPGQVLTFTNITGTVSYNSGANYWGPDGYNVWSYAVPVLPYGGISGITDNARQCLIGIFLDDTEPESTPPENLDFGPDALTHDFDSIYPDIKQLFFIGDGVSSAGLTQKFYAPATATRLFLGFVDTKNDYPGNYDDNLGYLTAAFNITLVEPVDTDGDETPDYQDNCPTISNADQADSDNDGTGDECDVDYLRETLQQTKTELEACLNPTLIQLSSFEAKPLNQKIKLQWRTESEIDNAGFNIWRVEAFKKINTSIIPSQGSPTEGGEYDYLDLDVFNRIPYFYLLEDVDTSGTSTF